MLVDPPRRGRREPVSGVLAILARFWPRGRGRHVRPPGLDEAASDDTVIFPRIPDDGIPPSMMTVFDVAPVRQRPYVGRVL